MFIKTISMYLIENYWEKKNKIFQRCSILVRCNGKQKCWNFLAFIAFWAVQWIVSHTFSANKRWKLDENWINYFLDHIFFLRIDIFMWTVWSVDDGWKWIQAGIKCRTNLWKQFQNVIYSEKRNRLIGWGAKIECKLDIKTDAGLSRSWREKICTKKCVIGICHLNHKYTLHL